MSTSRFTFAELELLLQAEERWPFVREALGLGHEPSQGVVVAGMASLIARELAWLEGDDLMVSPIVEVPVKALVREGVDVSLALTIGGEVGLSSFRALADGAGSLLISVVGPGVVDIKLQSEEMAATEVLVRVVSGLLATEDAAVTLGCAGTVLQIRHTDDRWEARTLQESPFEPIAAADVRDRITEMFGPLLEGRA